MCICHNVSFSCFVAYMMMMSVIVVAVVVDDDDDDGKQCYSVCCSAHLNPVLEVEWTVYMTCVAKHTTI